MNRKGITPIVIILIIVGVLVLAGGVWYWQNQKEKEGPKPGEITTDETANWKTYRNEEHGLEFKYPEDWNEPTIKEGDPYYKGEYFFVGISDPWNLQTSLPERHPNLAHCSSEYPWNKPNKNPLMNKSPAPVVVFISSLFNGTDAHL